MKGRKRSMLSKRLIGEMTIRRSVDRKNKRWEVHQHAGIVGADEPATALFEVCSKTIERHGEARDVEGIPNEDTLSIERDNN